MEVILCGSAALDDEIAWFKREASKWDVSVSNIVVQTSNHNYCRFLESLMLPEVHNAVAVTALWAIEAVYQESFANCLEDGNETPPELQEVCQRWDNKGFGGHCLTLRRTANRCLENTSDGIRANAEVAFLRVLEHDIEFWNMSHGSVPERVSAEMQSLLLDESTPSCL